MVRVLRGAPPRIICAACAKRTCSVLANSSEGIVAAATSPNGDFPQISVLMGSYQ